MSVNKMAGLCLMLLAFVNALHEIALRSNGRGNPGIGYAIVTALFFTFGVVLFLRRSASQTNPQRVKEPLIFKD